MEKSKRIKLSDIFGGGPVGPTTPFVILQSAQAKDVKSFLTKVGDDVWRYNMDTIDEVLPGAARTFRPAGYIRGVPRQLLLINRQISQNLQITVLLAGPEEERRFRSEQMKLWGPVVREHGIKGD